MIYFNIEDIILHMKLDILVMYLSILHNIRIEKNNTFFIIYDKIYKY